MSEDRIKELQDFAEDFKKKLKYAKERYEQTQSKSLEIEDSPKKLQSNNFNLINKTHKIKNRHRYVNNIIYIIQKFNIYKNIARRYIQAPGSLGTKFIFW